MSKFICFLMLVTVSISVIGCGVSTPTPQAETKATTSASTSSDTKEEETDKADDTESVTVKEEDFKSVTFKGKTYSNGRFTVGKDIDSGIYVVYGDKVGVVNVYKNGAVTSSYSVDSGSNIYLNVEDDTTIELQNTTMGKSEETELNKNNGVYLSGMYLIGKDIPEGSYTLKPGDSGGIYEYYKDCTFEPASLIASSSVSKDTSIELKEGNYIVLTNVSLVKE